jgi:hypothetical protein
LEEDAQKMAAEKDATIASLNGEIEALKKQVDELNAKIPKRKKWPNDDEIIKKGRLSQKGFPFFGSFLLLMEEQNRYTWNPISRFVARQKRSINTLSILFVLIRINSLWLTLDLNRNDNTNRVLS